MPSFYELLDNAAFEGKSQTVLGVDGATEPMMASPFSLHAISIISTQFVCTLRMGISMGNAKVNRLWCLYRNSGAKVPNVV